MTAKVKINIRNENKRAVDIDKEKSPISTNN